MTGPDHYRSAEQHIEYANELASDEITERTLALAEAQVHATLALVAAETDVRNRHPGLFRDRWQDVT